MEKTKKCPYCGEEIHIEAQKCKHCGEWLDKENTTVNESLFNEEIECGNEEVIEDEKPFVEKGFFGYYWERIWRFHKFDTNGCVSRSEFWKYVLCCNVVCFFIMMTFLLVMSNTGDYMKSGYIILMLISGALLLQYSITSICMAVRRLHDNDKSGWLLLLSFIPFLNIYLLYLLCKKGRTHDVDVPFKRRDIIQLVLIIVFSRYLPFVSSYMSERVNVDKSLKRKPQKQAKRKASLSSPLLRVSGNGVLINLFSSSTSRNSLLHFTSKNSLYF